VNVATTLLILTSTPFAGPTNLDQNFNSVDWRSNFRRGLVPYHNLVLSDFKVLDKTPSDHLAYTTGFIEFRYEGQVSGRDPFRARITRLRVWSGLDRNLTWYKRGLENASEWISHEQGHLDINEIAAYQFASTPLSNLPVGTGRSPEGAQEDLKQAIAKYFNQFYEASRQTQARYDQETSGGTNKIAQVQWKAYLAQALKNVGVQARWSVPAGS
jgi:hypothetical protein